MKKGLSVFVSLITCVSCLLLVGCGSYDAPATVQNQNIGASQAGANKGGSGNENKYQKETSTDSKGQLVYSYIDNTGNFITETHNKKKNTTTITAYEKKGGKVLRKVVINEKNGAIISEEVNGKAVTRAIVTQKHETKNNNDNRSNRDKKNKSVTTTKKNADFNDDDGWSDMH